MIKLDNICKTFKNINEKKEVLQNVSFEIEEGKISGFLGVNGSGKTTLIKTILRFISYDSGNITYKPSISNGKGGFHSIGYLPERPYYYTNLTGEEFLKFSISLSRSFTTDVQKEYRKFAERLSIDNALKQRLDQYSKGMLQKVGFISNLVSGCKILILDEPLSGLDLISREEYKKILTEYSQNGGSVFISSHILSDLEEVTDNIIFLDSKSIKFKGSASEFFSNLESGDYIIKYEDRGEFKESKCSEDSLKSYLNEVDSNSDKKMISVYRDRKSFKQYVQEIRNEI